MKQVIWVIVVLLVIWGVYALATGKKDNSTNDEAAATEQTGENAAQPAAEGSELQATTTVEAGVNAAAPAEEKAAQ